MGIAELQGVWEESGDQISAKHVERDAKREKARPIYLDELDSFLNGKSDVGKFRGRIDSLTKTQNHWGAGGMNNQMMFNQLVNAAEPEALTTALKAVFPQPENEEMARRKLSDFIAVIEKARGEVTDPYAKPGIGRVNSFVSFFWEMQNPDKWPRYFPTSRDVLAAEGLLNENQPPPDAYLEYRDVMEQLKAQLDTTTWGVEHLLWYVGKEMKSLPTPPPWSKPNDEDPMPPGPPASTIYQSFEAEGLHYPDDLVTSLILSLATKRFVILSGISGTGKTQIARGLAKYLELSGGVEPIDFEPPESDENNLYFRITGPKVKRGWTTLKVRDRKIIDDKLRLPERGTSKLLSARLPDGSMGELRLNNLDFADKNRELFPLYFKKVVGDWLKADSKAGEYLHLDLNGDSEADLVLRLIKGMKAAETEAQARHATIAVKSEWTDPRGLIGYYNPLLGRYMPTKLIKLLLRAEEDPENPYVVILDEMNLARVEYYFSDFLSAMESGESMELMPPDVEQISNADEETEYDSDVPAELDIPPNVSFIGTVNVDETTHAFSPKVLDRANVIEFNKVDLAKALGGSDGVATEAGLRLKGDKLDPLWLCTASPQATQPKTIAHQNSDFPQALADVHSILTRFNRQFGYRVIEEMSAFVGHALEKVDGPPTKIARRAFDLQLKQKVIPKLSGGRELEEPLAMLLDYCLAGEEPLPLKNDLGAIKSRARERIEEKDGGDPPLYPESARKLLQMLDRLYDAGFVGALE